MSNIPISTLPVAISLDGSEYVPLDQGGTTKRATVSLINSSNPANLPPGGITGQALVKTGTSNYQVGWVTTPGLGTVQEVDTGTGLTGGPITLMGTVSLAPISTGNVLANTSGISAAPTPTTPSSVLDVIGSTRGQILYRGASGWAALSPGSAGQILTTGGAGTNPAWSAVGSGTTTSVGLSLPAIFSVTGSPVTTSGTLTATLANQNANLVWSGPSTGAAAAPTFRSLVGADLPNPSASTLGGVQSKTAVASNFLTQISTSGAVSSAQPAFSDISGTLALSQLGTQTANTILAGPTSGGSANPTFRSLVGADLPNPSPTTLGGVQSLAATTSKWINQISTSGVPNATQPGFGDISGQTTLGQLPSIGNNTVLANTSGGSGVPAATSVSAVLDVVGAVQGDVLYRGASSWSVLAPGTNGQVLTTGGASANPSWTTVTGTGTVTSVSAGTGIDTGGSPITTTGSVSLAAIAGQRILANITGGLAVPSPNTMTSLLDFIGQTQGQILYRGASTWSALGAGTSGQFLQTLGVGSTPQWASAVTGPGSSTNNGFVVWNGTTGTVVKDHAATISLTSEVSGTLPTANGGLGNTAGAWTAYSPTPVPDTGSFTTVSTAGTFYVIGKLVHFRLTITITSAGSAAGGIRVALPVGSAAGPAMAVVGETANTGVSGVGRITGSNMIIVKYDASSLIATGNVLTSAGIYEQT
ncbi:hypothetical protein IC762_12330 [Bradyrhizobium genosp. L]|uniref:beta strand repeat-containing protein n=1 Tax=Bradyrhizobium genosp. L TaxID=83637 RepID=UPI0018A2AE15|nr:hypothetical protein [Bradyrhizobium genosp. L]QPF87032.1 hypothetical protein IC762_12330 [Bradyrhizobium genosp. L]